MSKLLSTVTLVGVILHHLTGPEKTSSYYEDDQSESGLDDSDAKNLFQAGIVEAWYWYRTAPYEGDGYLIGRKTDGTWVHTSLSHCSCYGPTDGGWSNEGLTTSATTTPDNLLERGTEDFNRDVEGLVSYIKETTNVS